MTQVAVEELRGLALAATRAYGYGDQDAEAIVDVLMYAQLRGNNQGVVKLVDPGIPVDPEAGDISFVRPSVGNVLQVDGARNHAMVVVRRATDAVTELGTKQGLGVAGVRNVCTPSGAIGYYARRIAEAGLVGIVFAGSPPAVAAAGSNERLFGTNPLAIAIPSSAGPVVLDMATAAVPYFAVVEAKLAGLPLPEGVAYAADGTPTTDPAAAMSGALATFDNGPKSSGLAFVIQALTGPLVGASFFGLGDAAHNWGGHLILSIDPARLGFGEAFSGDVTTMLGRLRSARRQPGVGRIAAPGELGDEKADAAIARGVIEVEVNLLAGLRSVAAGVLP